jgi:hypothetical protein
LSFSSGLHPWYQPSLSNPGFETTVNGCTASAPR